MESILELEPRPKFIHLLTIFFCLSFSICVVCQFLRKNIGRSKIFQQRVNAWSLRSQTQPINFTKHCNNLRDSKIRFLPKDFNTLSQYYVRFDKFNKFILYLLHLYPGIFNNTKGAAGRLHRQAPFSRIGKFGNRTPYLLHRKLG